MRRRGVTLLAVSLLSVLALGASALTATASAEWQFFDCVKIAAEKGGSWSGPTCGTAEYDGPYARTRANTSSTVFACYVEGSGGGGPIYADPNCAIEGTPKLYEWVEVSVGSEYLMHGKGMTTMAFLAKPFAIAWHIECTKYELEATPEGKGKQSNGVIAFTGCTATKPSNCKVKEPFKLEVAGQLEGGALEAPRDKLAPTGGSLATLALEGEHCSTTEPFEMTGTQTCGFDEGITSYAEKHELKCATTGSALKLGGASATLSASMPYEQSSNVRGAVQQ